MYLCSGLSSYMLLILFLGLASPQMSAGKNDGSIDGLSGVTFDDDVVSDQDDDELSTRYLEFGLCIPQDRLEEVDFSPKFDDDWIRLDDHALFAADFELHDDNKNSREKPLYFENSCYYAEDEREFSYLNKKPRTKKSRKENPNRTFQVLRRGVGKRSPVVYLEDSRERKMRCTHCQAEDTPQWRLGPLGPNTLCNACGLRFKIGRLVANYRPAASPSFDSAKHSNFYKRLMRSKQHIKVQNYK